MQYHFYTFTWTQENGKKKALHGSGMFYTKTLPLSVRDIKNYVRNAILKDPAAQVSIDRESEIDQLMYEILTENPFKPGNPQYLVPAIQ